jgi:hypothetical protein
MRSFILFLLFIAQFPLFGQKTLRLDTGVNPKKIVYGIGSTLVFKIDDSDIWHTEYIKDMDYDRNLIVFETWQVFVRDITAVRKLQARKVLIIGKATLKTFGLGLVVFGGLGAIDPKCPNCKEAVVTGAAISGIAWLLDLIKTSRDYKIGGRTRLILLDLTPQSPQKLPLKV